ncbi:hypothetical protein ACFT5B_11420 [Luteimicrobium sp. NPDC057192]|uniref:hypothetical protein n=1 Tax=Luteimicrobium sp. NPDC057192 TaxID=3346042 RepID=UPI0036366FB1
MATILDRPQAPAWSPPGARASGPSDAAGTTPESLLDQWQSFVTHDLAPLGRVALSTLVVLAVLAGLARLLVVVAPDWPTVHRRGAMATAAGVLGAGAAAVLTFGVAARGGRAVPAGLALGAGAVVLGAWWLATRLRLTVSVTARDGSDSKASSAHIVALLADLGATPPRGLELPRGSDVSSLTGAIGELPQGKLAQLALGLVQNVLGSSPWRALVDVVDPDTLAVAVTRNGRQKGAAVVDRTVLRVGGDLHRFAAAVVVTTLARAYPDDFRGLCGATDWRSLGLHYVATTDFQDDRAEQRRILARSLERDPGNWLAQLAYHNVTMRYGDDPDVLRAYRSWLTEVLRRRLGGPGERSLALRALYTRLSVDVNAAFAESTPGPDGAISGVTLGAQDLSDAAELVAALDALDPSKRPPARWWRGRSTSAAGEPAPALADDLRACAAPLVRLVADRVDPEASDPVRIGRGDVCDLSGLGARQSDGCLPDSDQRTASDGAARSPKGYYTLACAIATYCDTPSAFMIDRAVGALRLAAGAPSLRDWMWRDPQLRALRTTATFRRAFGAAPRTDLLALPLLLPFADALRRAALTSVSAIRRTGARDLVLQLGAAPSEVQAVQGLAALAQSLLDDAELGRWAVEVLHELGARGIVSTRALVETVSADEAREDLVETVVTAVVARTAPLGASDAVELRGGLDRWTHRVVALHLVVDDSTALEAMAGHA